MVPDDIKPSMALLAGCAYQIIGLDEMIKKDLVDYFRNVESLIYMKQTKKSVKEIDLKANILILENECTQFFDKLSQSAIFDQQYYEQYIMNGSNALYMFCVSGSSTNIKPEMLIDLYMSKNEKEIPSYDIERLDMFSFEDKYISMSCNKEGLL